MFTEKAKSAAQERVGVKSVKSRACWHATEESHERSIKSVLE